MQHVGISKIKNKQHFDLEPQDKVKGICMTIAESIASTTGHWLRLHTSPLRFYLNPK